MTGEPADLVLAERRGPVLVLTFNRPGKLNAWTDDLEDRYFTLLVDAEEALLIGLVDHLVPDGSVVDAAVAYAADLAAHCSPTSMAVIKDQLNSDADGTYADSVARAEGLMLQAFRGADLVEGVQSHLDKRTPVFPSLPVRSSHVPV